MQAGVDSTVHRILNTKKLRDWPPGVRLKAAVRAYPCGTFACQRAGRHLVAEPDLEWCSGEVATAHYRRDHELPMRRPSGARIGHKRRASEYELAIVNLPQLLLKRGEGVNGEGCCRN